MGWLKLFLLLYLFLFFGLERKRGTECELDLGRKGGEEWVKFTASNKRNEQISSCVTIIPVALSSWAGSSPHPQEIMVIRKKKGSI